MGGGREKAAGGLTRVRDESLATRVFPVPKIGLAGTRCLAFDHASSVFDSVPPTQPTFDFFHACTRPCGWLFFFISSQEVQKHRTPADAWMVYRNKVYDVSGWHEVRQRGCFSAALRDDTGRLFLQETTQQPINVKASCSPPHNSRTNLALRVNPPRTPPTPLTPVACALVVPSSDAMHIIPCPFLRRQYHNGSPGVTS